MVARVVAALPIGFDGALIEVEADAKAGLPTILIVGMGNKSIDEARERVRSAITNSLLDFPTKKLVINLAPAELPKDGTYFDLPIALSILVSSGQLRQTEVDGAVFVGELALDGSLRAIRGVINIAETARQHGFSHLFVPVDNVQQAALVEGIEVIGVGSLRDLYLHLKGEAILGPSHASPTLSKPDLAPPLIDDVQGQEQAKRALIIATAGHHNLVLSGPPGTGKTMLAKVLVNLLPPLRPSEQIAVTKIHSLANERLDKPVTLRPFRAPHHTASQIALIGGGGKPRPGEISFAHLGVLFLDELPEFPRHIIETLRQPLEDRWINIARANGHVRYPADFILVATMNPCPCGYLGDPVHECVCSATQIAAYQKRLSGPFLDRIDLRVTVPRVPHDQLLYSALLQNTQHLTVVKEINNAMNHQFNRYKSSDVYNGTLINSDVKRLIQLAPEAKKLLDSAAAKLNLSARSYFKILKVARTIADLDGAPNEDKDSPNAASELVQIQHISEALQFR